MNELIELFRAGERQRFVHVLGMTNDLTGVEVLKLMSIVDCELLEIVWDMDFS